MTYIDQHCLLQCGIVQIAFENFRNRGFKDPRKSNSSSVQQINDFERKPNQTGQTHMDKRTK
jgi:hypothetical protein